MWPRALLVAAALLLLVGAPSSDPGLAQAPLTQDPCPDATEAEVFLPWETQLENLAFDGSGAMYVTDWGGDRLLRVTPDGSADTVFATDELHGLTFGPDAALYLGAQGPDGDWQVWRFADPTSGSFDVYATGLAAANGMAFDGDGDLYVSDPLGDAEPYLVRLPAEDPHNWTGWSDIYGPNGLTYDATTDTLLAAVTGDQASPILRVTLGDAPNDSGVATLSFGVATLQPGWHKPHGPATALAPKGLDDLTLGDHGLIYVTAHLTGELLRVDPTTQHACVLASGLGEPTSVRAAHGFGPYDGDLFVTTMGGVGVSALVSDADGAVLRIPRP